MKRTDEYRRNALECQRMADNTRNPTDKASWLRLAASWLGMLKNEPEQAHQDENRAAERTKWPQPSNDDSQASH